MEDGRGRLLLEKKLSKINILHEFWNIPTAYIFISITLSVIIIQLFFFPTHILLTEMKELNYSLSACL